MQVGGNISCLEFLASHGIDVNHVRSIRARYDTPAADLYQQVLKAKVDGTLPIPTKLPPKREPKKKMTSQQMTGFGSSAHPREVRKENRKKLAVVGSALVSVAAVAWGLSKRGMGKQNGSNGAARSWDERTKKERNIRYILLFLFWECTKHYFELCAGIPFF
jgi:hypothetical protein